MRYTRGSMGIKNKQSGFTIVELLIVIVVIGILAAIVIVAFNGIQNRAVETAIKSDLANAAKKMRIYHADNDAWPANNDTVLSSLEIGASRNQYTTDTNNFLYCGSAGTSNYVIIARGKNNVTYAQGSDRAFEPYTGNINDYTNSCTSLNGSSSARYGYTTTDNWRWLK